MSRKPTTATVLKRRSQLLCEYVFAIDDLLEAINPHIRKLLRLRKRFGKC